MNNPIEIEYKGKTYWGYKKCPKWLKDKYRKSVNYTCQDCKKNESEVGKLEPHRIKRGIDGGLYMVVPLNHKLNNVKIICHNCHEQYNYSRKLNYQYSKSKVVYK